MTEREEGRPAARRSAVFVVPVPAAEKSGPVAAWLSAAGWAAAAQRVLGEAWVVTPSGTISPDEARAHASRPSLTVRTQPGWRRHLPEVATTALKDLRQLLRASRFRGTGLHGPWSGSDVAFVWQRHELFQRAGFQLAHRLHKPLVLFVAAPQVWEARRWGVRRPGWGRLLERVGEVPQLRAADLVACTSEEVAHEVRALGVPPTRVMVTPSGFDPELFHPDVSGDEVRGSLGLTGRFVVGWSGSFRPFHGLDTALQAVASVQDKAPETALLLVGDGPERPGLEELARKLGVEVRFTGTVPHIEIPSHLAAMDVALLADSGSQPYHYSPIKLREYMGAGRAIVAPRVGDLDRFLDEGVTGLLTEVGDVASLATAILRLRDDPTLRSRLGTAAREQAAREATWDCRVEDVCRALDQLDPRRERIRRGP